MLQEDSEFKQAEHLIYDECRRRDWSKICSKSFSQTSDDFEVAYESIRKGLKRKSSSTLDHLNELLRFDPSFLRAALIFLDQGVLTEPLLLKFYLGGPELPFGLPPTLKSLEAYLDMLKGVRVNWFAATMGGDNLPLVPVIVSLGGHVRIGLEDYQYARDGQLSNPQITERAASMIRAMGHEVATPAETRKILEL